MGANNFAAPIKNVRVKINSKPLFYSEIIIAIRKRDKLYQTYKKLGLKRDKDIIKTSKTFLSTQTRKHSFRRKISLKLQKFYGVMENFEVSLI